MYAWKRVFGPLDLIRVTCGTKREAMSVILRTISDTADQNGAAELKPALRAKRITAEHHLGVRSQTKVILDFKKDSVSILCTLRPDWPFCTLAYCTLRYSQLTQLPHWLGM